MRASFCFLSNIFFCFILSVLLFLLLKDRNCGDENRCKNQIKTWEKIGSEYLYVHLDFLPPYPTYLYSSIKQNKAGWIFFKMFFYHVRLNGSYRREAELREDSFKKRPLISFKRNSH